MRQISHDGNLIFNITVNAEYRLVDNEIISLSFSLIIFLIKFKNYTILNVEINKHKLHKKYEHSSGQTSSDIVSNEIRIILKNQQMNLIVIHKINSLSYFDLMLHDSDQFFVQIFRSTFIHKIIH